MTEDARIAIVGTGTMGPGMGAVMARQGHDVVFYDISGDALERAKEGVERATAVLDQLGSSDAEPGAMRFTSDLEDALNGVGVVIEAVPERLDLKRDVFAEMEGLVDEEVILASNTSGIRISDLADGMTHPGRIVGMHWSNPPHLIPMIEIVPGDRTDQSVVDQLKELVSSIGYEPVVEKEIVGFVENRILYAIMRECLDLIDEGIVDQEGLDTCVRWGIGYKLAVIGPMALIDMAGVDIYHAVGSYLNKELSSRQDVAPVVNQLIEEGKLGLKTLSGMYEYAEEDRDRLGAERAQKLVAVRKALAG